MSRSLAASAPCLARAFALLTVTWLGMGCVSKPTIRLNHAEISGVRIALPPRLGILMKLFVNIYNPNSYDVAVRSVRGQVLLAQRYSLPVDFRAEGEGVWLASRATTSVAVPVNVPIEIGIAVVRESFSTLTIPYHFKGRADVTASRTLKLEADDSTSKPAPT